MIRYIWKEGKYLYPNSDFSGNKIRIPYHQNHIFVNILERIKEERIGQDSVHVKLFYTDGTVLEGWYLDIADYVTLVNDHELYDGRFNQ